MTSLPPHYFDSLADAVAGDVCDGRLDRYLVATDGSIFKKEPAAVVYPRTTRDVVETVCFARSHNLSVHPRGAGSGLCGSALGAGVVIDFTSYMNRLLAFDPAARRFECEPGLRYGELCRALQGSGLFFPPDPSSGEYASLGGMYATNASGAHSVKYGNVADYIVDARIVLSSGEVVTLVQIARTPLAALTEPFAALADLYQKNARRIEAAYPSVRHNVAGYNLRSMVVDDRLHLGPLFSGAEGTLGVVTRLTFRLLPKPAHDSLVVAFFDHISSAARAVVSILPMGPAGIEVMDKSLLELARESDPLLRRKIPAGVDNVLLMEFDGETQAEARTLGQKAKDLLIEKRLTDKVFPALSAGEKQKFWAIRTAAVPILYRLKGEKKILALIEDAVVPIPRLEEYFEGLYRILEHHGVRFVLYGHIAKGLIHTRPLLNLKDPADIALLQAIADDVFELVDSLGGSVSGEHGDGRLRSAYIARRYPQIFPLFLSVKKLLDPENIFNPEIKNKAPADQMRRNLRYGEAYRRREDAAARLYFSDGYMEEIEKCHGCAKCTTITTATRMCPVYKFTRREAAAPKAKANVLRALISGAVPAGSLYTKEFQTVIDQCVNCGSCKVECPSHVDIPRLALEARRRIVARNGAPLSHHLLTQVEPAGRLMTRMSLAAPVVKRILNTSFAGQVSERVLGLSRHRRFPAFAHSNLRKRHGSLKPSGRLRVLYFAGCYAGYLRPEIGEALIAVLRSLQIDVLLPEQHCCGLPLLTKGWAEPAARKINENLAGWYHLVDGVDHIVVTCSSCGLALVEEWGALLHDGRVKKVANKIVHASRLIERHIKGRRLGIQSAVMAYHMPCHLKVQPQGKSSVDLLSVLPGLTLENLDSHCCGMAGTWGMTAANYSLSYKIGRDLIARLDGKNLQCVVTDCPTCAMQLEQIGSLPVRHPVEVVAQWSGGRKDQGLGQK